MTQVFNNKKIKQDVHDKGLEAYMKGLEELSGKTIRVGVLAEDADEMSYDKEGNPDDVTLIEKAESVEYGIGQPPRPVFRTTFEIDEKRIKGLITRMDKKLFAQSITPTQITERIGQEHTNRIKTVMRDGREYFVLNSKWWAKEKGKPQLEDAKPSDVTPTIYTGQYRQSINFKVE